MAMTARQWSLYNFLSSDPGRWFTQREICENVEGYTYCERNNDRSPCIRDDKLVINASPEVDKIVVMKNYCFKIGTVDEYKQERAKHIRRLKNQVQEIQNMDFKYDRHGQMNLVGEIYEAFFDTGH